MAAAAAIWMLLSSHAGCAERPVWREGCPSPARMRPTTVGREGGDWRGRRVVVNEMTSRRGDARGEWERATG
eukprot:3874848-Pyramimonas_sp.AAC.1